MLVGISLRRPKAIPCSTVADLFVHNDVVLHASLHDLIRIDGKNFADLQVGHEAMAAHLADALCD